MVLREREKQVQRSWDRNVLDTVEEQQEANLARTEAGRDQQEMRSRRCVWRQIM